MRAGQIVSDNRDLGQSIHALCAELERVQSGPHEQEILLAGIQWKSRGRVRPVAWGLGRKQGRYQADHLIRRFEPGRFSLGKIGSDEFTQDDLASLTSEIEQVLPDPVATENAMLRAIRGVAQRSRRPIIGPDCVTVLIPAPSPRRVMIYYRPVIEAQAQMIGATQRSPAVPAAFSPFVVAPDLVLYPSIIVGAGSTSQVGAFTVELHAPDLPYGTGVVGAISSQKRPRLH